MCECKGMDVLTNSQKRSLRDTAEDEKFDPDHYCGDYFTNHSKFKKLNEEGEDPLYSCARDYKPWWDEKPKPPPPPSVEGLTEALQDLTFDETEREALLSIPNKEHLISDHRPIFLSLIDILFGYCYDYRMTEGESNVESPWTISILSPTLSWFECWDSKNDSSKVVMAAAARRALIYPYCRFLGLATMLLKDILRIMGRGRRAVLKALLASRAVMEKSDTHYMLNKFYLDDYVLWVQKIEEGLLGEFTAEAERGLGELEKDDWRELKEAISLDILELENMVEEQSGL